MKKYDVAIVGAGPAGIFTALEMLKKGSDKRIVIIEKGKSVENRKCPKSKTGRCMSCKPYCHITTGFYERCRGQCKAVQASLLRVCLLQQQCDLRKFLRCRFCL